MSLYLLSKKEEGKKDLPLLKRTAPADPRASLSLPEKILTNPAVSKILDFLSPGIQRSGEEKKNTPQRFLGSVVGAAGPQIEQLAAAALKTDIPDPVEMAESALNFPSEKLLGIREVMQAKRAMDKERERIPGIQLAGKIEKAADEARQVIIPKDQTFLEKLFSGGGSILGLAPLGVAGGVAGKVAGLSPQIVGSVVAAIGESELEAHEAEKRAIAKGMTAAEAKTVKSRAFWANFPFIAATNIPGFMGRMLNGQFGKTAKEAAEGMIKSGAKSVLPEAGQEFYQSVVGDVAVKDKVNLKDAAEQGLIGGILGGLFGGAAGAQNKAETIQEFKDIAGAGKRQLSAIAGKKGALPGNLPKDLTPNIAKDATGKPIEIIPPPIAKIPVQVMPQPDEGIEYSPNLSLIDKKVANWAHQGTSFSPEKRGEQEIADFGTELRAIHDKLKPLAKSPEAQKILFDEMKSLEKTLAAKKNALLRRRTGLASSMIAGPSNFPVDRMRKKNNAFDAAVGEYLDFQKRASGAIAKKLNAVYTSEQGGEIEVIKKKIANKELLQEKMKQANKVVRENISDEEKIKKLIPLVGEKNAAELLKPDFAGRKGFAPYEIQSTTAEIKRLKDRIATFEERDARTSSELKFEGGSILKNSNIDRIQIFYDAKPSEEIIGKLRSKGFKWSPSNKAWQRQWTKAAEWATQDITGVPLQAQIPPSSTSEGKPVPPDVLKDYPELQKKEQPALPVEGNIEEGKPEAPAEEVEYKGEKMNLAEEDVKDLEDISDLASYSQPNLLVKTDEGYTRLGGGMPAHFLKGQTQKYINNILGKVKSGKKLTAKQRENLQYLLDGYREEVKSTFKEASYVESEISKSEATEAIRAANKDEPINEQDIGWGEEEENIGITKPSIEPLIQEAKNKISDLGLNKKGFVNMFSTQLKSQNLTKKETAENIKAELDKAGMTIEDLYDAAKGVEKSTLPEGQETPLSPQIPNMTEKDALQKTQVSSSYSKDTIKDNIDKAKKINSDINKTTPPAPPKTTSEYEGKFELPDETKGEAFRRVVEDFNIRLKALTRAIEKTLGGKLPEHLDIWAQKDMLPRVQSDALRRIEGEKRELTEKLVADGLRVEEVDKYLLATHAKERNAKMNKLREEKGEEPQGGLSGMPDAEAESILAKADDRFKKYREFATKMAKDTLDFELSSGLIDQETYDKVSKAYSNYVPLFRDIEDDTLGIGAGIDIRGKEIKRAKGSEKRVLSPLGNLFAQKERAQVRALKNRIGKSVLELTEQYSFLKDLFEVEKQQYIPRFDKDGEITFLDPKMKLADNVIGVKRGGKQYFITIKDPGIYKALKNMNVVRVHSALRVARSLLSIWSGFKTRWRPEFLMTNFERDLGEAIVNLGVEQGELGDKGKGLRTKIVKDLFPSLKQVYRHLSGKENIKEVDDFLRLGGDTGHFWASTAKETEKSLLQIEKEVMNVGVEKVFNSVRSAGKVIDNINSAIELGIRFSTYKNLVKLGFSKEKAVQSAADLTVNFSRQGEISPFLKSIYGFINPSIQGTSKVLRSMTAKKGAKKVAKGISALVLTGFILQVISSLIDDEEDDKIPDWTKNHKLAFAIPGGKHVTLWSMPYGFTTFYALGRNMAQVALKKKTMGEAFNSVFETAVNSFSPFGTSMNDVMPTLLRPISDISANRGWYDGPIHPQNQFENTPSANSSQYFKNAKEPYVFLSSFINKLTGGDDKGRAGIIDVYPNDFQYLFDQYFGGPFEFAMSTMESFARGARGEFDPNKTPFVRQVIREGQTDTFSYGAIYDTLERARKHKISDIEKKRFFKAVEMGEEEGVFDDKKSNKFKQEFIKGIYAIDGPIDSSLSISILNEMPKEDKDTLLNTYSMNTRKGLIKDIVNPVRAKQREVKESIRNKTVEPAAEKEKTEEPKKSLYLLNKNK